MREVKKASSEDEKQLVREQVGFREICRRLDQLKLSLPAAAFVVWCHDSIM